MLAVPHLRQLRAWSCGPACVRMVLAYYGITSTEVDVIADTGCDSVRGTAPNCMVAAFHAHELDTVEGRMDVRAFRSYLKRGRPVIVAYQDHGPRGTDYSQSWDHGHYSIVVGADERRITLCDPSSKRPRRHFKIEDFIGRWRDIDSKGRIYRQWGLSVGPKK